MIIFLRNSLILAVILLGCIFMFPSKASASTPTLDEVCADVETIFARGSGQQINDKDREAARFFAQIDHRIRPAMLRHQPYELGSEKYDNFSYPAVKINEEQLIVGVGATLTAGGYYTYKNSVDQGVGELKSYLKQRYAKCKDHHTLYILGGVSQGAQVIGQALPGLSTEIRDSIVYVGLFGDPKLHYPEGEGIVPIGCFGYASPWRKTIINALRGTSCFHDNGWLQSRKPYLPDDMKYKTGLWCYKDDFICNPTAFPNDTGHGAYDDEGQAVDQSAMEAISKLKIRLATNTSNPPKPNNPSDPTPPPTPQYQALDTRHILGEGTAGENVVFAVDVSTSMQPELPAIEQFLREAIPKVAARGNKVSLVLYYGQYVLLNIGTPIEGIQTTSFNTPLDTNVQPILDHLSAALQTTNDRPAGSALRMIDNIYNNLSWTDGATKSVTIFTNNPVTSPDNYSLTTDGIAMRSLAIDPVNIYPVVPETLKDSYASLADKTAGHVVTYTNDIASAARRSRDIISTERPVALLTNATYAAEVGQEFKFDASPSYILNDEKIAKYEWDFDGNNTFETTTTTPSITHAYSSEFDGIIQVKVSTAQGITSNASAKIHVGHVTPPVSPSAPQNLVQTIVATDNNKSTVKLDWTQNPDINHWMIRINDMPIGYIDGSQNSIEITDIERSDDVTLSVMSVDNNSFSETSTTTLPKITPPPTAPPVTSTCTQSNIFLRILCQAIALYKQYLNGVWLYILPYRI